jgi:hypothetical protein
VAAPLMLAAAPSPGNANVMVGQCVGASDPNIFPGDCYFFSEFPHGTRLSISLASRPLARETLVWEAPRHSSWRKRLRLPSH